MFPPGYGLVCKTCVQDYGCHLAQTILYKNRTVLYYFAAYGTLINNVTGILPKGLQHAMEWINPTDLSYKIFPFGCLLSHKVL